MRTYIIKRGRISLATLEASATLLGVMIGAGILGLPYVVAKSGITSGLITISVVGLIMLLVYLYTGELTLRTTGAHQLPGYIELYLGKIGKFLAFLSMIIGDYGALIAYSLGTSSALSLLFGFSNNFWLILFFIFGAVLIYKGVDTIKRYELFLSAFIVFTVVFITIMLLPNIRSSVSAQAFKPISLTRLYIPFGITLFAMLGFVAIPEMKEELMGKEKQMKKAIIIGTLIPIIIYLVFSLTVALGVGINNFEKLKPDQRLATIALAETMKSKMAMLSNIFAMLAMITSFLAVGLALKEMFLYDYKLNPSISWLLTVLPPFIVSYLRLTNFMQILNMSGVFAGGLMAILILITTKKSKILGQRKPEYTIPLPNWLIAILSLLFILGVLNLILT